jgi:serine acetyltransferase/glycosyltransferase involved in cell wall biosynthesis
LKTAGAEIGRELIRHQDDAIARRVESVLARVALFVILTTTLFVAHGAAILRRVCGFATPYRPAGRLRLLLTGTFHHDNWIRAHILPLAQAKALERIYVVVDQPRFAVDKVVYVSPPSWARRLFGRKLSRLLLVVGVAARERPDLLMGYHIMPNALLCLVTARLLGLRAAYQMTGGPTQIIGGGVGSENPLLRRLRRPSALLERLAVEAVRQFDLLVVRGRRARAFLDTHGIHTSCLVVTGGIDTEHFTPRPVPKEYDIVCVSRLVPNKGVEYLLEVLGRVRHRHPTVRAAVVGDGSMRAELQSHARALGIAANVEFLGSRPDIAAILQRSRLFALTSPSEGMSIAMLEAMSTGLPVAVTDVGELGDAVDPGCTGAFLSGRDSEADAAVLLSLLTDEESFSRMSAAARAVVIERYGVQGIARRWDGFFRTLGSSAFPRGRCREPAMSSCETTVSPGMQSGSGIRQGKSSSLCLRFHRAARWLLGHHLRPVARVVQLMSRVLTGADIDPLAELSEGVVIPHTIGIVVGETAVVEKGAILMPHVVLGARDSAAAGRRHPHIGAGACIGAGAVVLGPIHIGAGAVVGANAVVVEDVPPGAIVVGVPARPVP